MCALKYTARARAFFLFSHYVCDKTKAESPEVLRPSLTYKIKSMTHRARRRKSQSGNNTSVYSSGPPRKKGWWIWLKYSIPSIYSCVSTPCPPMATVLPSIEPYTTAAIWCRGVVTNSAHPFRILKYKKFFCFCILYTSRPFTVINWRMSLKNLHGCFQSI